MHSNHFIPAAAAGIAVLAAACGGSAPGSTATAPAAAQRSPDARNAAVRQTPAARNGLIAFMRPGTLGEYDLWAVRPDGTGLLRLTRSPQGRSDYNPDWSPDGTTVLFERRKPDETADDSDEALYAVDSRGGRLRQITHCTDECWSDSEGSWSADGSRIAFGRATGPRSAPGPALVAIYVANANGSEVTQVSRPPSGWEDHYPTWAADGRTVIFERDRSTDPAGPSKLVAANVTTGAERVVYALPPWAPSAGIPKFSPDGKHILFGFWCVFGDSCPPASRSARNSRLATISPDGSGLHVLRLNALADSGAWSPDGKRIAFRCRPRANPNDPFKLCTSKLNGTALRRFPWPLQSAHPDWGTHP